MLSIEQCQQILNKNETGKKYTPEEVKVIRNYLYAIAEVDVINFKMKQNGETSISLPQDINQ